MLTRLQNPIASPASMTMPPWALSAWPPVFWQANSRRRPRFVHLATRITTEPSRSGPCAGHTIWSGISGKGDAGLAWDWVEVADGVVAMVDPMRVVSNMHLVGGDGAVLPATKAALYFNQFVRRLPWQEEVARLLLAA